MLSLSLSLLIRDREVESNENDEKLLLIYNRITFEQKLNLRFDFKVKITFSGKFLSQLKKIKRLRTNISEKTSKKKSCQQPSLSSETIAWILEHSTSIWLWFIRNDVLSSLPWITLSMVVIVCASLCDVMLRWLCLMMNGMHYLAMMIDLLFKQFETSSNRIHKWEGV